MTEQHEPALVARLEVGGTVIERCSNFCSSTLNLAHILLHVSKDADWKVTIEPRQMTSEEYDAMRAKYAETAVGEMLALDLSKHLEAEQQKGGD